MKWQYLVVCIVMLFCGCIKPQIDPRNVLESTVITEYSIIEKEAPVANMFDGAKILMIGTCITNNYLLTSDSNEFYSAIDSTILNQELSRDIDYFGIKPYGLLLNYMYFQADSINNINYFVMIQDDEQNRALVGLIVIYPSDLSSVHVSKALFKQFFNRSYYDDQLSRELLTTRHEIYGFLKDSLIVYQQL